MRKLSDDNIITCSVCGTKVTITNFKKYYLYKLRRKNKIFYQCSEKCYNLEKERGK